MGFSFINHPAIGGTPMYFNIRSGSQSHTTAAAAAAARPHWLCRCVEPSTASLHLCKSGCRPCHGQSMCGGEKKQYFWKYTAPYFYGINLEAHSYICMYMSKMCTCVNIYLYICIYDHISKCSYFNYINIHVYMYIDNLKRVYMDKIYIYIDMYICRNKNM